VALITGSAQGIGFGIAQVLAGDDVTIAVADIRRDAGEAATRKLSDSGARALFIEADVSRKSSIQNMIEQTVAAFGRLDILINNAAPSRKERLPFAQQTETNWDIDLDLMLKGYVAAAQSAAPHLETTGGCIVNLSSVLARAVSHESAAYHVAKAGVEQLTRYMAYELGSQNIRVNAVAPGLVDRDTGPKLTDDPVNKSVVEVSVPLGRTANAVQIGRVVAFLCSGNADYVTGQTIVVDGGLSLGEPFGVGRRAYHRALEETRE
jgi:3-oxoacyl-[acyl-carrier protein] reductase